MKKLLSILFLLPLTVVAYEGDDADEQFAEEYIVQFDFGMPLIEVREILLKKRDKVEIFNKCTEDFEFPMTACDKGYSLVTTIKLPDTDSEDRGDLQLYFSFNAKQMLMNSFYEIYYTEQHSE